MIENSTLKLGGNTIFVKFGEMLEKLGKNISSKNRPIIITNPTARLVNPFTLIVNFTVDTTNKYQIVLQGDFKTKYKEIKEDDTSSITEEEMFKIISGSQKDWFKKE